jgi:hypothetical protein
VSAFRAVYLFESEKIDCEKVSLKVLFLDTEKVAGDSFGRKIAAYILEVFDSVHDACDSLLCIADATVTGQREPHPSGYPGFPASQDLVGGIGRVANPEEYQVIVVIDCAWFVFGHRPESGAIGSDNLVTFAIDFHVARKVGVDLVA